MVNRELALSLLKARLNRVQSDTSLDAVLEARIEAAISELEGTGIELGEGYGDLILVVDYTAWTYQNRDKSGAMPDWLRLRRRERWLRRDT